MKVITFLNEKGGVGKTTLSTHIAAGLAIRGGRVVLIDADPQGNATSAMGLEKKPNFYDLTVRNAAWRDVLIPVHPDVFSEPHNPPAGKLYCVSGNGESRNIANSISSNSVIRRRFSELKNAVDYIIVDTSPTPSLLHAAITLATDYILVPTDCEAFSALEGLPDSIMHTGHVREAASEHNLNVAQLLGIIPTKYRAKTISHNEVLGHLREHYGDLVWDPLSMTIVYSEAQLMRQFLFGVAPDSKATHEIWRVVDRVIAALQQVENPAEQGTQEDE